MKKLKRLFSPRNLAATEATGMLVFGAVTAWADILVSACQGDCNPGSCFAIHYCSGMYGGNTYRWCCGNSGFRPFTRPPL